MYIWNDSTKVKRKYYTVLPDQPIQLIQYRETKIQLKVIRTTGDLFDTTSKDVYLIVRLDEPYDQYAKLKLNRIATSTTYNTYLYNKTELGNFDFRIRASKIGQFQAQVCGNQNTQCETLTFVVSSP